MADRDDELAELTRFCTQTGEAAYAWWRAGPWAGKSALMSWFVLHPPPGTDVISFFITARFAGQSDRVAFADVVLEQLADLLGQPVPAYVTEANRDAHVLGLLADAAAYCNERGRRLVLIVDGLDEDRGFTEGPDAYSIAALLPKRPVAGMRVVVAGRPNPPVPADVPLDHPLHDSAIVRPLSNSPHAQEIQQEANRELRRLLRGTRAEQDLLGLVAAAGGGLSGADLARLTELPEWQIDELLTAVTGRTFMPSTSPWQPTAPDVYVLGHENLQVAALDTLGGHRLDQYRHRIHDWADDYRRAGWPADTPEYLLRGYYSLLVAAGQTSRVVDCATDAARHDRMLDITGGDTAALAEITAAHDHLLSRSGRLDLPAMARLAQHRDHLAGRNAKTPCTLPAVWLLLGQVSRAEALARSIPDPYRQAEALTALAETAWLTGDRTRSELFSDWATAVTASIADRGEQVSALTALISLTAGANRRPVLADQAQDISVRMTDRGRRAHAEVALAEAMALGGETDRVSALVSRIFDRPLRARALTARATAAAVAGDRAKATDLMEKAVVALHTLPPSANKVRALGRLAQTSQILNDGRAGSFLDQAREAAIAAPPGSDLIDAECALVQTAVAIGARPQAWSFAYAIPEPGRAKALLTLVRDCLTGSDADLDHAEAAAQAMPGIEGAEALALVAWRARTDQDPDRRERAKSLAYTAETLIRAAESDARGRTDPLGDLHALLRLADSAWTAKDQSFVDVVRRDIEKLLTTDDRGQTPQEMLEALTDLAAKSDDLARVLALTARIMDPATRAATTTAAAATFAARGHWSEAESLIASLPYEHRDAGLARIAETALARGDHERAESIAAAIATLATKDRVLVSLVRALAESGQYERAKEQNAAIRSHEGSARAAAAVDAAAVPLVEEAIRAGDNDTADALIDSITNLEQRVKARIARLAASGKAGDQATAESLIDAIALPEQRARAAIALIPIVAAAGHHEQALAWADRTVAMLHIVPNPTRRAPILADLAQALNEIGEHRRALDLATSVVSPFDKLNALLRLARAAVHGGDVFRAEQLIDLINPVVTAVQDGPRRDDALIEVIDLLVAVAGITLDPAQAENFATQAEEKGRAVSGNEARTEATARVLAAFAEATAKAVDPARANMLAERSAAVTRAIPGSDTGVEQALSALARRALTDGHRQRAVALAQAITAPDRQAALLTELALTESATAAEQLLALAFRVGHWTIPLVAFAQIRPSDFRTTAQTLLRTLQSHHDRSRAVSTTT